MRSNTFHLKMLLTSTYKVFHGFKDLHDIRVVNPVVGNIKNTVKAREMFQSQLPRFEKNIY